MAEYQMQHSGAELDAAIGAVLDNYRDVSPVTARAQDVVYGKVIVTSEGPVYGTNQGIIPPASWQKTASGAEVTITDGITDWPLHSLAAEISHAQSGSGTPSPSNIRPITGEDSVTVEQNGDVAVTVIFPDTPGTVYGGTMNFKTGVLTVTWELFTYDGTEEGWALSSSTYKRFAIDVPKPLEPFDNTAAGFKGLCNIFATGTINSSNTPMNSWWYFNTGAGKMYFFWDYTAWTGAGNTTLAKWKAFLADMAANDTPLTICVPLAEPVTYQLMPSEMPALESGSNTFAADTGSNITVVYYSLPEEVSE